MIFFVLRNGPVERLLESLGDGESPGEAKLLDSGVKGIAGSESKAESGLLVVRTPVAMSGGELSTVKTSSLGLRVKEES
jgi:hypothetical protein